MSADVARRLLTLAVHARFRDLHAVVDLAKGATTTANFTRRRNVADVRFEACGFVQRAPGRMPALRSARGFLLFRSGALAAARDEFALVLAATSEEDREAYLTALSNLMSVRVELRDTDSDVERAVALLLAENASLDRAEGVARAVWMTGRMHMYRGQYDDAAALLTRAMRTVGDSDASIRAGVDALEALLLADRADEAFALARDLASVAAALDGREPSRRHKLTRQVSAYLHEAAHRQALCADLVTDVARYLDRMMRQAPFDFVPPMPLTDM